MQYSPPALLSHDISLENVFRKLAFQSEEEVGWRVEWLKFVEGGKDIANAGACCRILQVVSRARVREVSGYLGSIKKVFVGDSFVLEGADSFSIWATKFNDNKKEQQLLSIEKGFLFFRSTRFWWFLPLFSIVEVIKDKEERAGGWVLLKSQLHQ
ncbi:hypothetical protein Tco_0313893 [Tanacetum coccineum]